MVLETKARFYMWYGTVVDSLHGYNAPMAAKNTSSPNLVRVAIGQRLAYYRKSASADYWDKVWATQETRELYEQAAKGNLGYYEEIFPKHLPKDGVILEAGSGLGQFVMALKARGYEVEGVDYGERTVNEVKSQFPDLPIRLGDVTNLDVPDGYYSAYISLGVMEHDPSGPTKFLLEAYRVLKVGGVALISTPYINPIRALKMSLGQFTKTIPQHLDFYQYAYSAKEFDQLLRASGFSPIAHYQYGGYKGIKDELPGLQKLFGIPKIGWRIQRFFMNWNWANGQMGHMMMYVCEKTHTLSRG